MSLYPRILKDCDRRVGARCPAGWKRTGRSSGGTPAAGEFAATRRPISTALAMARPPTTSSSALRRRACHGDRTGCSAELLYAAGGKAGEMGWNASSHCLFVDCIVDNGLTRDTCELWSPSGHHPESPGIAQVSSIIVQARQPL